MLLTRQERYCGIRSSYLKILNAIVDVVLLKQMLNKQKRYIYYMDTNRITKDFMFRNWNGPL